MSVLRQDPTTHQWGIVAPVRGDRPHSPAVWARPELPARDPSCPFCPGNEDQTPPEVARDPADGWQVRVVPNKYGALGGNGSTERGGSPMFRDMPGVGSHEVVIESPRHDARMHDMSVEEVSRVVRMWRARYRELIAEPQLRAVVVFKNFGTLAGTSLVHPHSQVVATPVFLPRLIRRLDVATRYFDDNGHCVYDDLIEAERDAGARIVEERGGFVSLVPFAAATPFETWILPTSHESSFGEIRDEEIEGFASLLRSTFGAIRAACGDPDYNLVLYSAPLNGHPEEYFHWHVKILPKLTTPAGFEIGSAMSINTVLPEDSAVALRGALHHAHAGQ